MYSIAFFGEFYTSALKPLKIKTCLLPSYAIEVLDLALDIDARGIHFIVLRSRISLKAVALPLLTKLVRPPATIMY